jgi:hypothetical protein
VRNVTLPTFRIAPSWARRCEQKIKFLPQQLLLGVLEQFFGPSIGAHDPSIAANNDHGIRGGFQDLSDSLADPVKLSGGVGTHNTSQ